MHKANAVIWLFYAKKIEAEVNKESLETLKDYRKKIVGIVNAIDEAEDKKGQLDNAIKHFGEYFVQDSGKPVVFPYSSKLALEARRENNIEKLQESGFGPLYSYLTDNFLNNESGLQRDKLLSVRDTLKAILEKSRRSLQSEIAVLQEKVNEYKEKTSKKEKQIEEITYVKEEGLNDEIKDIVETRVIALFNRIKEAMDNFIDEKMTGIPIKEIWKLRKREEARKRLAEEFSKQYFTQQDYEVFRDDLKAEISRLMKREWHRSCKELSVEILPHKEIEFEEIMKKHLAGLGESILMILGAAGVVVGIWWKVQVIAAATPGPVDDAIVAIIGFASTIATLILPKVLGILERKKNQQKGKIRVKLDNTAQQIMYRMKQHIFKINHRIAEEIIVVIRKKLGIIESNYFKYNEKIKTLSLKDNGLAELIRNAEVFEI